MELRFGFDLTALLSASDFKQSYTKPLYIALSFSTLATILYVLGTFIQSLKSVYRMSEKDCTLFYFFFFLGAQCVESGVSCTDCY